MNTAVNTEDIFYKFIKDNSDKIETPFENDFWDRKALADRLTDHVSRINVGATIAIDAEWGAGKSWFVNNWKAKLEQDEFKVIYLNAFNQDYIDDPFLTISMEIANCLKTEEDDLSTVKEKIGDAYRAILPNLPMLLWYLTTSLAGMGAIAKPIADIIETLKDTGKLGEEAGKLLNEKLQEHLSTQVENYDKEKKSLEYFKEALAAVTSKLDTPLVFIVDELDRCKPEFAIRLIERIKHFFDIPKVVFILAVNKTQLEESINNFYGFSNTANYLEKFIDFSVMLKSKDLDGSRYTEILTSYNQNFQLSLYTGEIQLYTNLCKIYNPNPRQLIRIINKFSLLKTGLDNRKKIFLFLFLIYSEMKLIEIFTESYFIDHFYDSHFKFYEKKFQFYSKRQDDGRSEVEMLCDFLNYQIYSLDGDTSIFELFFLYVEFIKCSNQDYKDCRNPYYPTFINSNDFIHDWHNYVHMIEG